MFERFTAEARTIVIEAQQIARDSGSSTIDGDHVLAGIARSAGPGRDALLALDVDTTALADTICANDLDAEALAEIGIDLATVREHTDELFGPGALDRAGGAPRRHLPFSRDGKKTLELALREALRLKTRSIDGSHLLLGILRADGAGKAALMRADVDVDALRRAAEARPAA